MAGARASRVLRWASCPAQERRAIQREARFPYTERRSAPGRMPAAARRMRALRPNKPLGVVSLFKFWKAI